MSYYVLTAIVALAASKSKVQFEDHQTNHDAKNNANGEEDVARNSN